MSFGVAPSASCDLPFPNTGQEEYICIQVKVESTRKKRTHGTGSAVDSDSLQHTWVVVVHTSDGVSHTAAIIACGNEFNDLSTRTGKGAYQQVVVPELSRISFPPQVLSPMVACDKIYKDERERRERRNVRVHDAERQVTTCWLEWLSLVGRVEQKSKSCEKSERGGNGPLLPFVETRWEYLYARYRYDRTSTLSRKMFKWRIRSVVGLGGQDWKMERGGESTVAELLRVGVD